MIGELHWGKRLPRCDYGFSDNKAQTFRVAPAKTSDGTLAPGTSSDLVTAFGRLPSWQLVAT